MDQNRLSFELGNLRVYAQGKLAVAGAIIIILIITLGAKLMAADEAAISSLELRPSSATDDS